MFRLFIFLLSSARIGSGLVGHAAYIAIVAFARVCYRFGRVSSHLSARGRAYKIHMMAFKRYKTQIYIRMQVFICLN